jgi:sulfur-carrier protein
MPTVEFTSKLNRFFPDLKPIPIDAATVSEAIRALDETHPGLAAYLVDETGALRRHVNLFINNAWLRDRQTLSDPLEPGDRLLVMQALSGG